ncbi:MAG: peptide chain release factor N(5)-glutamine methyltransferase [Bacteroidales bacterium]|jgi:release factor glutamine methyltransferase|nr:peptide chain release factor N(5)-glutamine methyltransferase [Bacteroidales bacterium]
MPPIAHIVSGIKDELTGYYPSNEIDSFIRILLEHFLQISTITAYLEPDKEINIQDEARIKTAVAGLKKYCPVQYITSEAFFYGLVFKVTPDVLIPRPETEELVHWVIHDIISNKTENPKILDIGCGSGCIAISLAANIPDAEVWAVDISKPALEITEENVKINRVCVHTVQADILSENIDVLFPETGFDVIVSNPPYVTLPEKQDMSANVLNYEPHRALFPLGDDPLVFYDRIAAFGAHRIKENGTIYFEINEHFPEETGNILTKHHYSDVNARKDIRNRWRMIRGSRMDIHPAS